jgi:hypothetical protein
VFISGNMIEGRESITSSTFLDSVGNGDDTP